MRQERLQVKESIILQVINQSKWITYYSLNLLFNGGPKQQHDVLYGIQKTLFRDSIPRKDSEWKAMQKRLPKHM